MKKRSRPVDIMEQARLGRGGELRANARPLEVDALELILPNDLNGSRPFPQRHGTVAVLKQLGQLAVAMIKSRVSTKEGRKTAVNAQGRTFFWLSLS